MALVGRSYSAGSEYRYGFNGKEEDKDISEGAQDYGMRVYDERLGRFLSVDPLSSKYPFYTPYSFAGNKPIQCVDLDGAEEALPFQQSAAFNQMKGPLGVEYTRGKKGDNLAITVNTPEIKKSYFEQFLESINPIKISPYVAQAINFGKMVGSVAYELEAYKNGEFVTAGGILSGDRTLFINLQQGSELVTAIVQNLKSVHGIKNLTDDEMGQYISDVKFLFHADQDYSYLFWEETEIYNKPKVLYNGGPISFPLGAPAIPIALPPISGGPASINGPLGSIMINVSAISQEIATTLAPAILKMSKKTGNQLLDDLTTTLEGLNALKVKIKERTTANSGKTTEDDTKLLEKIKTQEKAIGERNKQKRKNK